MHLLCENKVQCWKEIINLRVINKESDVMSSAIDKKERVQRLKNYVNQISISDPSIKFELIKKIENGKLTSSSDITTEIELMENYIRARKNSRSFERIKAKNENISIKYPKLKEKQENEISLKQLSKEIQEIVSIGNEKFINETSTTKEDRIDEGLINKFVYTFDIEKFSKKERINFDITPKEDRDEALERKFRYDKLQNLNIFHALYSDIYFLYDYIPGPRRKEYKEQDVKLSKSIEECIKLNEELIKYKNQNKYVKEFTEPLFKSIIRIYINYFNDKEGIALLTVPPSGKNKTPQTKKSIDLIKKWEEDGRFEYDFKVYNYYDLLIRNKSVPSSKEGDRTLKKHKNSIIFNEEKDLSNLNIGFIILDDITTSGNSMYACRDILIENGLENRDIISLAIARTVNVHDELTSSEEGAIIEIKPYRVERC